MSGTLILHRGARAATLDRIARVATPAPPETWYPIPHLAVLEAVEALRPGATPAAVKGAVARRGEHVVVVGHQPDCGIVAAALGNGETPRFPPAGMIVIDL